MPTPTHRSARADPLALADGWLQVVSPARRDPRGEVDAGGPGLELVLLDMDGTLVDASSWELVHEAFGVTNQANWGRYQKGELDDLEFMRSDIALWRVGGRRVHVDEIVGILDRAPLMPGARELIGGLRRAGVATCILSGGLDLLARKVCVDLGIDMYVANGLRLLESGHLHGDGLPFVEIRDKGRVAREILRTLDVPPERAAAVGNSAYDVPMFQACAFGVAVNPGDEDVRRGARHVVEGKNLAPVLPLLLQGSGA